MSTRPVFLYWIYTAAGIYGTGGGRFGESLPLPHMPAANNPTAVLYMPQTGIRGMRPLPHMPAAHNPDSSAMHATDGRHPKNQG